MKKNILIILGASLYFFSQTGMVYAAAYEYDDLGRVTQAVYEDGSSVTYVYDANGNIVETVTVWAEGDMNQGVPDHAKENAADKGSMDPGEETAGADREETNKEKEGSDGEESNKENKTESREGNGTAGKNSGNGDGGSTAAGIAGSITGALIAAMGLAGAFLWKKHKKETGSNETESKESKSKESEPNKAGSNETEPNETELHTSGKGRK